MRLWTKCDRCGKYIAVNLDRGAKNDVYKVSCNDVELATLCVTCHQYLNNWLKGRGDYGVIRVEDN